VPAPTPCAPNIHWGGSVCLRKAGKRKGASCLARVGSRPSGPLVKRWVAALPARGWWGLKGGERARVRPDWRRGQRPGGVASASVHRAPRGPPVAPCSLTSPSCPPPGPGPAAWHSTWANGPSVGRLGRRIRGRRPRAGDGGARVRGLLVSMSMDYYIIVKNQGKKPGFHRPDHCILVISNGASGPVKKVGSRGCIRPSRTVVATYMRGRNRWQCYQNVRSFARVSVRLSL
jgi:hypothetical protein